MKKVICFVIVLSVLFSLAACKQAPEEEIVVSKNNGTFDASVSQEEMGKTNHFLGERTSIDYESHFSTADGKVIFSMIFQETELNNGPMPIIQVTPHTISAGEAETVARLLFGDVEFYQNDVFKYTLPSEKVEDILLLWGQLASDDKILTDLYGSAAVSEIRDTITKGIENVKGSYDPNMPGPEKCTWTFYPYAQYFSSDYGNKSETAGTECILATTQLDDTSYTYWVTNRDQTDFRIHRIRAYVASEYVSVCDIETLYMISRLCNEEKATPEQLAAVQEKAEKLMEEMGLGDWTVDSCQPKVYPYWKNPDTPAYLVEVCAAPVYNGVQVLQVPQLESLKSSDIYASNYFYETLNFQFSNDGILINMDYNSPLDVLAVINPNSATLSFEETMEIVTQMLKNTEVDTYDSFFSDREDRTVEVEVSRLELGLARVKIRDNVTDFYLVPAVQIKGTYRVYSGDIELYSSSDLNGEDTSFLVLNLVDGSVINTKLGN